MTERLQTATEKKVIEAIDYIEHWLIYGFALEDAISRWEETTTFGSRLKQRIVDTVKHKVAISEARRFWSKIANENGWSMEGRKVQVWVDAKGCVTDHIYMPEAAQYDLIVNGKSVIVARY